MNSKSGCQKGEINTEAILIALLKCTLSMSVITILYAVFLPVLSKRYAAIWRYIVWLVIAACWLFPFRPRIKLALFPAHMKEIPVTHIKPIINAIPNTVQVDGAAKTSATIPIWTVLGAIWILGALSVVFYYVLRHRRFLKTVYRWSEPVTDFMILTIFDNLKLGFKLKSHVELRLCQGISSPMLIGFFRPVILLPTTEISIDELPLILKHELIHYKRHDIWYKTMILGATVIHWFNPVVYIMARLTAAQCEISCDALVLRGADFQQRRQYCETIIGVIRKGVKLQTSISTNFYGGKKDMKNRIYSIMDAKRKKAGVLILSMTMVAIIITGATFVEAANKDQKKGHENKNVNIASESKETIKSNSNNNSSSAREASEEGAFYSAPKAAPSEDAPKASRASEGVRVSPEKLAKEYLVYKKYGLVFDKAKACLYYKGKIVRYFMDILKSNGQPFRSGKFNGSIRQLDNPSGKGEVDVYAVRNYSKKDAYGNGVLIGVKAESKPKSVTRADAGFVGPKGSR